MPVSRISLGKPAPGVERIEVFLQGHAFSPHSHDTYAVGITTAGVQAFSYRGAGRYSLPDQVFVLHPDERHDGREGDRRGFGYRIAYVDPALIREAAEAQSLPFVRDPVSEDRALRGAIVDLFSPQGEPPDDVRMACSLTALAEALVRAARQPSRTRTKVDLKAVGLVRDLLVAKTDQRVTIQELENACGLTRWQLARQFRKAFGVSPYRFRLLRRIDRACDLLRSGEPLATVALRCGFADQAHLTRHFRRAQGLSPGQWRALVGTQPAA